MKTLWILRTALAIGRQRRGALSKYSRCRGGRFISLVFASFTEITGFHNERRRRNRLQAGSRPGSRRSSEPPDGAVSCPVCHKSCGGMKQQSRRKDASRREGRDRRGHVVRKQQQVLHESYITGWKISDMQTQTIGAQDTALRNCI